MSEPRHASKRRRPVVHTVAGVRPCDRPPDPRSLVEPPGHPRSLVEAPGDRPTRAKHRAWGSEGGPSGERASAGGGETPSEQPTATVLVVEDERDLVSQLRDALEHHGYEVLAAYDGDEGLQLATSGRPDVILLDLMLPGVDGMEVCRRLRERNLDVPILMLTARSEEEDLVAGFRSGADDYLTKPFSVRELLVRVQALLRRARGRGDPDEARVGAAVVDFKRYMVYRGDEEFPLTEKEVALLRLMVEHPHEVISRDRLLDEVWGFSAYPSTRTVDTFVYRLRQKIEPDPQNPRHLLTVWGTGYKLVP